MPAFRVDSCTRNADTSRVQNADSLFDRFGGTRQMARDLGESSSTIDGWKKRRRVSAKKQPLVLRRAAELGIELTAEDVMFPFPEDRAVQ